MLRDIEYFQAKLQHIDGFGETGNYLRDIIKSKQVKSASAPLPSETKTDEKEVPEGFDVAKAKSASPPPPSGTEIEKAEGLDESKESKDDGGNSKESASSDAK